MLRGPNLRSRQRRRPHTGSQLGAKKTLFSAPSSRLLPYFGSRDSEVCRLNKHKASYVRCRDPPSLPRAHMAAATEQGCVRCPPPGAEAQQPTGSHSATHQPAKEGLELPTGGKDLEPRDSCPISAPKYVISYAQEMGRLTLAEAASEGDPGGPGRGLTAVGGGRGAKRGQESRIWQPHHVSQHPGHTWPQPTDAGLPPRNTWIRGPPWPAAQQLREADELTFDLNNPKS